MGYLLDPPFSWFKNQRITEFQELKGLLLAGFSFEVKYTCSVDCFVVVVFLF